MAMSGLHFDDDWGLFFSMVGHTDRRHVCAKYHKEKIRAQGEIDDKK